MKDGNIVVVDSKRTEHRAPVDEAEQLLEKFPGEPVDELIIKLDKALKDTYGATAEANETFA